MKEQDAGQLGTDSPRETIQLVQKQTGIGLDPEPGEHQGETSYESFERGVFGFATDHLQFRLFLYSLIMFIELFIQMAPIKPMIKPKPSMSMLSAPAFYSLQIEFLK